MSNPFEVHNIQHLSPSTCNLFTSSLATFVMNKCLKKTSSVGPAAYRGTAVEDGVAHGLFNLTDLGFGKLATITPTKTTVSVQRTWATRLVDRLDSRHVPHSVDQNSSFVFNTANCESSQIAPTLVTQKGTSRRAND